MLKVGAKHEHGTGLERPPRINRQTRRAPVRSTYLKTGIDSFVVVHVVCLVEVGPPAVGQPRAKYLLGITYHLVV